MAKSTVVIFMKGSPSKPFDGYQSEGIKILDEAKIRYAYFDVMKDPVRHNQLLNLIQDVREILKEFSGCQSYPQVFIHGQFLGGGLTFMRE